MRALLIVLGSAGCGGGPDASAADEEGADTLGELFAAHRGLELPALFSLGLWKAVTGDVFSPRAEGTRARWGRIRPRSAGADVVSAHWEMAGVVLEQPFPVFADLPEELVQTLSVGNGKGLLRAPAGDESAILEAQGEEHLQTGHPIFFPGADSTLVVAGHERVLAPARLYEICRQARRRADRWRIARVVARPFTGEPGQFHPIGAYEYPMVPPRTVLNAIAEKGMPVVGVGSVSRIFAGSGITRTFAGAALPDALAVIDSLWDGRDDGLIFASVAGPNAHGEGAHGLSELARTLADFDEWLEALLPSVEEDDLVIITGDAGRPVRDPEKTSARTEVPLLVLHEGKRMPLGTRRSYADIAATLARYFKVRDGWGVGKSMV